MLISVKCPYCGNETTVITEEESKEGPGSIEMYIENGQIMLYWDCKNTECGRSVEMKIRMISETIE